LTATIASEPLVGRQTIHESEMALLFECTSECARNSLDTADIVRDGDFSPTNAVHLAALEVFGPNGMFTCMEADSDHDLNLIERQM
jgi:hypothetical protein